MKASLLDQLEEYDKTMLPFHMPGHKRNTELSGEDGYLSRLCAECDITEIAGFDNLSKPEGVLRTLSERAAKLYRSEQTCLLVNGSTCGLLASIMATVPIGGNVLVARNCHKSIFHGLMLRNAEITYLSPEIDRKTGIYFELTLEAVREALKTGIKPSLLILTSPTYEGIVSDIRGICELAHCYAIPVLVDSAHGAHFSFGSFPESAVCCGADLVVMSLHKTLPSLTQTALLHQNGALVSMERVREALRIFQTSSPSYLLLASIDGCISLLERKGSELFFEYEKALSTFYREAEKLSVLSVLSEKRPQGIRAFSYDRGKIVILTVNAGKPGRWLMERLRNEYHIELEMAAEEYTLAMTGPGDTEETLLSLSNALLSIDKELKNSLGMNIEETVSLSQTIFEPIHDVKRVLSFFEAEQTSCEEVPFLHAAGRIAAESVFVYPPGIPILLPGEQVSDKMSKELCYLFQTRQNLCRSRGEGEGKLYVVRK